MLDNSILVRSLCKLNHISLCFIQISTKSPAKLLIPSGKALFFLSHPRCLGRSVNFNITKISIKTARVSRLSVSCDYGYTQKNNFCIMNEIKLVYHCLEYWKILSHWTSQPVITCSKLTIMVSERLASFWYPYG